MYSRRPVRAPEPGPRPAVPRGAQGGGGPRDRRDHRRLRPGRPALRGGRVRRRGSAVLAVLDIRGFLSPATNQRADGYGGPLATGPGCCWRWWPRSAGRSVLGGRSACGSAATSMAAGGTTLGEAVAVARLADATGQVDYLSTAIGTGTARPLRGRAEHAGAAGVRHAPRGGDPSPGPSQGAGRGTGRISDPRQAERALADGQCDLVGVVRGQIADPAFAAKARDGPGARTRSVPAWPATRSARGGSGSGPLARLPAGNPQAGREAVPCQCRGAARALAACTWWAAARPACRPPSPRRSRGHRVTLFEQAPRTGGQVAAAAGVPGRAGFGDLVADLAREAARLGVDIRTGHRVDAEFLLRAAPDAVILATGSRPRPGRRGRTASPASSTSARWPTARTPRRARCRRHRRARLPPGHLGRRAAGRPRRPGRDDHQRHGDRPGPEPHPRFRNVEHPAAGSQGHPAADRPGCRGHPRRPGAAAADGGPGRLVLELLHHPTGTPEELTCDWVACAVFSRRADELWHALRGGGGLAWPGLARGGAVRAAPGRRLPGPTPGARRGHRGRAGGGRPVTEDPKKKKIFFFFFFLNQH